MWKERVHQQCGEVIMFLLQGVRDLLDVENVELIEITDNE